MKVFSLLILTILLVSCKRIHCPEFSDEYSNWIPYNKGDNLSFTDGLDTIKIEVKEVRKSSSYYENQWPIARGCFCEADFTISGDSTSPEIFVSCRYSPTEGAGDISYSYILDYKTKSSSFDFLVNGLNISSNETIDTFPTFNNGIKDYNNVIKMMKLNKSFILPTVTTIYIAASIGIIQFDEIKDSRKWRLIDTSIKTEVMK